MISQKLSKDITKFNYNTKKFNFQNIIFRKLKRYSETHDKIKINNLEHLKKNKKLKKNIEIYRQICFETFRSAEFQKVYKKFGIFLINNFFNKNALLQKTPTVRIQIPGEKCTPYHSDTWYGHGKSVRTFWLPLTDVNEENTLFVSTTLKESLELMKKIEKIKPSYADIYKLSKNICKPLIGQPGDIFTFSSQLIHGTEVSKNSKFRISFDFRIAKNNKELGIKSKSNFYSFHDLKKKNKIKNYKSFTGLFYTNYCNGISAKSQLMLCNAFCRENNIKIKGGDSEILPLKYLPVLKSYLTDKTLGINCVVVYGLDVFENNIKISRDILKIVKKNKITLIFCNENIFFGHNSNVEKLLKLVKK